jgi:hypothetical protein
MHNIPMGPTGAAITKPISNPFNKKAMVVVSLINSLVLNEKQRLVYHKL